MQGALRKTQPRWLRIKMIVLSSCFGVFVFFQVLVAVEADGEINITKTSCVQAQPTVDSSLVKQMCRPYKYPRKGYCKHIIGNESVYGTDNDQEGHEKSFETLFTGKNMLEKYRNLNVRDSCLKIALEELCRDFFPRCDKTSGKIMGRPLCRETCINGMKMCDTEFAMIKNYIMVRSQTRYRFPSTWRLPDCGSMQFGNGGDIPECYHSRHLDTETDKLLGIECYYGNGLGYRGNVSLTRSGHVCQTWSSQCPHRHDHPLNEYPELVNASNWCRNPGGQAPNGTWCYTTNSSIRWEYCDVEKCPPPVPTRAPVVTEAYATGSSKIFITWDPVPLPFVHGLLRGFRIKISQLGQEPMFNTTNENVTDFEYENLQPLTNYSLLVLAFNDAGDGPSSQRVYVKTMPKNYIAVRYSLTLLRKREFRNSSLLIKNMFSKSFAKKAPNGYSIFQIKIARFINSTNNVEFDITVELKGRSSWSSSQDITGRILRSFQENSIFTKTFRTHSLLVKAIPPPPASVSSTDVEMTSVAVDWTAPLYHGPYRITNYTVQYKKADTDMSYYDAVTVNSNRTKVKVKKLVSNTKYLMRVKSVNTNGAEASEPTEVETQATSAELFKSLLFYVVPLFLFIVIIGAILLRWWHKNRKENQEIQNNIQKLRENPYESAVEWFSLLKINITKQWWEIPRDDLSLDEELGSGSFGVVMKGYLTIREEGKKENCKICAVKTLKDNPTQRELRDLCNEINIMSSVGDHPNLVSLIGACTVNGPPWLVVRFAPNGCLIDYLKENRPPPQYQNIRDLAPGEIRPKPISERERMRFAYEIAQGMAHLERYRFVHRDLAARNVLLGKNMVAMVSDFGLSRDIYESGAYKNTAGGVLPVRWMALESLQDYTYNCKSDVWSYGVLLWEIESGGLVPYAGMFGLELVERLRQGYRLERPRDTSRGIYGIMWQCWNPDPTQRPTFADIVQSRIFEKYVESHKDIELTAPDNDECNKEDTKPESQIKMEKIPGLNSLVGPKYVELEFTARDIEI